MRYVITTVIVGLIAALAMPDAPAATAATVTIVSPLPGTAVAGLTSIQVNASAVRAELYVDSVLAQVDTSAPFAFSWDTAASPLPAPNHPIDYGYFLADGRYGDFRHEVNEYTNLYHAWARRGYEPHSGATDAEWLPLMRQALTDAAAQGRRIYLNLNLQEEAPGRVTPVDAVLDIAAPVWDHIVRIELADEPGWSRAETDARIQSLRHRLKSHGLAQKPMGNIYTREQARTEDAIFADGLDFVTIEAYVDVADSSDDSQHNIDYLIRTVSEAKQRVPAGKQIGLVMQAYARNNAWTNVDTLRDLQIPTYLLAYNDPRVVSLTMFSFGRVSGTGEHRALMTPHRLIGERIIGSPMPRAGDGPRTIAVRVFDATGNAATHRVSVHAKLARRGNFAGSHGADPAIFRPSTGEWFILNPEIGPPLSWRWGTSGDIAVPGDFLGDGKLDPTVYRPASGRWIMADSGTWQTAIHQWGLPGDIPVSGDFLADPHADLAVYRPSSGTWYLKDPRSGHSVAIAWGHPGDIPLAGNYLGDLRDDLAVYRPSTGTWFVRDAVTGATTSVQWGLSDDIPVSGDFTGDHRADIAVFRPSTGTWFIRDPRTGQAVIRQWGASGDIPVSGDYFGDTHAELVLYRPSQGTWLLMDLTTGQTVTIPWGHPGDRPVS